MEFTSSQIAAFVGGTVEGNPNAKVNTFAKIEEAGEGAITFLANPKYTHFIYSTNASVVLVSHKFVAEEPVKATLIRVEDPYATLSRLLEMVSQVINPRPQGIEQPSYIAQDVEVHDDCYVGAFAYIGKGAKIGHGVCIYPQAYVGDGCEIGDNTIIYPGAKIYHGCKVGNRCIIHAGAVIGADGFGFAPLPDGSYNKIPQIGNVEIGDDVEIGANTTIDRATMGSTVIEHGVKLDNLIQAAHNTHIGHDTVMAAQSGIAGSTKVGSNCMIGGQVGFAGHINIGNHVMIGAQSGISKDLKDGAQMMGYPAVELRSFAAQTIHVKRLGSLYDRVATLEKILKNEK